MHLRRVSITTLALGLLPWMVAAYFGFFLWRGNYGLPAEEAYRHALKTNRARLEQLTLEQQTLTRRVQALRSDAIAKDTDMLEEQTRKVLGYAAPDEWAVSVTPSAPQ